MKYVRKWYRFANKIISIHLKKCVDLWENGQRATFAMHIKSSLKREKAWKNLFESFTIPKTPWKSLMPPVRHFQRNQKGCYFGCPFLIVEDVKSRTKTINKSKNEQYFGFDGNKLFQMYDFQIHDERANCQIVTVDRIVDAIISFTEHEVRFTMVNNKSKHFNLLNQYSNDSGNGNKQLLNL